MRVVNGYQSAMCGQQVVRQKGGSHHPPGPRNTVKRGVSFVEKMRCIVEKTRSIVVAFACADLPGTRYQVP